MIFPVAEAFGVVEYFPAVFDSFLCLVEIAGGCW